MKLFSLREQKFHVTSPHREILTPQYAAGTGVSEKLSSDCFWLRIVF
jgi:hypothetical protein